MRTRRAASLRATLLAAGTTLLAACSGSGNGTTPSSKPTPPGIAPGDTSKPKPAPDWLAPRTITSGPSWQGVCPPPDPNVIGEEAGLKCELSALAGVTPLPAGTQILEASILTAGDASNGSDCSIAVKTGAGWGISDSLGFCGSAGKDSGAVEMRAEWLAVDGGGHALLIHTDSRGTFRNYDDQGDYNINTSARGFLLCGFGSSQLLACTPHIYTAQRSAEGPADAADRAEVLLGDWSAEVSVAAGPIVTVGAPATKKASDDEPEPELVAGRYLVEFP